MRSRWISGTNNSADCRDETDSNGARQQPSWEAIPGLPEEALCDNIKRWKGQALQGAGPAGTEPLLQSGTVSTTFESQSIYSCTLKNYSKGCLGHDYMVR